MRKFLCFVGLICIGFSSTIASELTWKQNTIELAACRGDKKVEAEFAFTNSSSAPVEIRNVRTSCGCTTTELTKRVYQPGEEGTIKTVFTLGNRKGHQEKTIVVQTKGGQDILTLRVDIPDSIKLNKDKLTWQVGDPVEEQSVTITVLEPSTKVKSVKAVGSNFEASLSERMDGQYEVIVKPLSTEKAARSTIKMEIADPAPRSLYLPVQIQYE